MRVLLSKLLGAFVLWLALAELAVAKTWLPDHDTSGSVGNSYKTAHLVDILRTGPDGRPTGFYLAGELGGVTGGFDTRDIIKIQIPRLGDWELGFYLRERPETTMWIQIHDVQEKLLYESRGAANEDFAYRFSEGTFFITVLTTPDAARGRLLTYNLRITPTSLTPPDLSGSSCANAQTLGINPNGVLLTGIVGDGKADVYYFINRGESSITAARQQGLTKNTIFLQDSITQYKVEIPLLADGGAWFASDPGPYCFAIDAPAYNGPQQYAVKLINPVSDFRPGLGSDVATYNLGNQSRNLAYKDGKRRLGSSGAELIPHQIYVLREWIDALDRQQEFMFVAPTKGVISGSLINLRDFVGLEIVDFDNHQVAIGQSDPLGTGQNGFLPHLKFEGEVEAKVGYKVRLTHIGRRDGGTSYNLSLSVRPSN